MWAEPFALARQGRYRDALTFLRRRDLKPTDDGNRHLLVGEIYFNAFDDGAERMRVL